MTMIGQAPAMRATSDSHSCTHQHPNDMYRSSYGPACAIWALMYPVNVERQDTSHCLLACCVFVVGYDSATSQHETQRQQWEPSSGASPTTRRAGGCDGVVVYTEMKKQKRRSEMKKKNGRTPALHFATCALLSFWFISPRHASAEPRLSASSPRTLLANAAGLPFLWLTRAKCFDTHTHKNFHPSIQ